MRLTEDQVRAIREEAERLFGGSVRVLLFGSRVDERARGGDIDLYVETDQLQENRASAAARLAARLQRRLGERRIDVILVDPATPHLPIHDVARKEGVRL